MRSCHYLTCTLLGFHGIWKVAHSQRNTFERTPTHPTHCPVIRIHHWALNSCHAVGPIPTGSSDCGMVFCCTRGLGWVLQVEGFVRRRCCEGVAARAPIGWSARKRGIANTVCINGFGHGGDLRPDCSGCVDVADIGEVLWEGVGSSCRWESLFAIGN
jgi:hypothetical protein